MPGDINRCETTFINVESGSATCTSQWLLENRNLKNKVTHPITHNNKLTMFICGKDGFSDIANEINNAKESIDLCCWGFDPGMELKRNLNGAWPRGDTYGDMLIAAGRRGVRIRLLVWFDRIAKNAKLATNMPGLTHETTVWRVDGGSKANVEKLGALNSLAVLRKVLDGIEPQTDRFWLARRVLCGSDILTEDNVHLMARQEYCYSWYRAAFAGYLHNIEVRTHTGDAESIKAELAGELKRPRLEEGALMKYFGTHHQKPVLIDFEYDKGSKAVGYVMGLNSVSEYWDTAAHKLENPSRETMSRLQISQLPEREKLLKSLRPLRDYACRIDSGGALVGIYNNFVGGWNRAKSGNDPDILPVKLNAEAVGVAAPFALTHAPRQGDSTVQIVRTQPAEKDQTIREIYFKAADNASLALGYLYMENQYFQYEDWTAHFITKRQQVMEAWKKGAKKSGKVLSDMPILHTFIVIPMPEREEMIPRTYDALAHLGQEAGMVGQQVLIDSENDRVRAGNFGPWYKKRKGLPEVVRHANTIEKPNALALEKSFGLKVCTAMLNACGFDGAKWTYREIYIHSKLLLVDDVFCTIGSANLNQRSMVADSELNLATIDTKVVKDLRLRIWSQLTGGVIACKDLNDLAIEEVFDAWTRLMRDNRSLKLKQLRLLGPLQPLYDERSSTTTYG